MYYKTYKKDAAVKLSALSLGSLRLPTTPGDNNHIDRAKAHQVIDQAFASGINYFDTAYTYHGGDSERFLGESLSRYPRDSYYLATKFYAAACSDIEKVFEEQLRRCQTDYFDFYLFHGLQEQYIDDYMDAEKNYIGYLLDQKKAGRIRRLGFSSHAAPETLERFLNWYPDFDMAMIQLNYLDWTLLNAKRQYEILTEHGIPVWVMEPLKGGRLTTLNPAAKKILKAASPKASLASWSFRHLIGLDNVQTVLSGMSTKEEIIENASIFSSYEPLNLEEQNALHKAVSIFKEELGIPCSACRYCCPVCPKELDIPLLLQGYNEVNVSGETWRLSSLNTTKGPENCIQCGACKKRCPQRIDIPAVLNDFKNLLSSI